MRKLRKWIVSVKKNKGKHHFVMQVAFFRIFFIAVSIADCAEGLFMHFTVGIWKYGFTIGLDTYNSLP